MHKSFQRTLIAVSCMALSACGLMNKFIPSAGANRAQITRGVEAQSMSANQAPGAVQLVVVTDDVVRQLQSRRQQKLFSQAMPQLKSDALFVGLGDSLEVNIWEAPPAALFGSTAMDARSGGSISTARNAVVPEVMVNRSGEISVPFAGSIKAAGRTLQQIEAEIAQRLKGKANQPQVQVRLIRNVASSVTVVGEVTTSAHMSLTAKGERLLDALASVGGVRHPVNKVTIQLTRGAEVHALPLDTIIRDPRQNVTLLPGDVITALHEPLSFTALGAVAKNDEIAFEGQGISLAQALARVGGLQDQRSDAQGVFVFRLESAQALNWPRPVIPGADGKVPVIYRIDLHDPRNFFVAQAFVVENRDLVYVSNAPAADLQKFVNLIAGIGYPVATWINVTK
jgi:polysaccharide biosynthesis/export protein